MSRVCLLLNSQFIRGNGQSSAYVPTSLVLLKDLEGFYFAHKCSVSSERCYHICFLIDLAFGK